MKKTVSNEEGSNRKKTQNQKYAHRYINWIQNGIK